MDTDDDHDIASEWDTIKNVPKTKHAPSSVNLRNDILDLRHEHPDIIYRIVEGFGVESMALWECVCHARREMKEGRTTHRPESVFIYTMKRILIAGPGFTNRETKFGPYSSQVANFAVTLEAAVARWEDIKQKHIRTARENAERHRKDAEERLQWAEREEKIARDAEAKVLRVEDIL